MRPFEYATPETQQQAISLLGATWGNSEVLAGGTDLLALMKDGVVSPKRVVNLKAIRELQGVNSTGKGLRILALTKLGDCADNVSVVKSYPALAEALHEAASPQIRHQATIGGNLCQRPRCWYFRSGYGLLPRDKAGTDLVVNGENRYHAILGNDGPAKFVSPSSIVPVLIAYGATVRVAALKGLREVPLEKFYVIPKSAAEREHDLQPNEIVTEVMLPEADGWKVAHYEVRQKQAFDWPLAVAAIALKMQGSTVQSARVIMGHVAPVPWRSAEAEAVLTGNSVNEETAKRAADAALKNAKPLSQNAYKVQLAKVAVKRAILKAAGGPA
jgi:xanthine dehydrogenase YagS FAD-binding subunit